MSIKSNEPLIKGVPMPTDPEAFERVNNALNNILKRGVNELGKEDIQNEVKRGLTTIADLNKRISTFTSNNNQTAAAGLISQRDKIGKSLSSYFETTGSGKDMKSTMKDLSSYVFKDGSTDIEGYNVNDLKKTYERTATLGEKAGAAGRVATQWLFGGNAKQIGARSGLVLGGIYGANKVMDWLR